MKKSKISSKKITLYKENQRKRDKNANTRNEEKKIHTDLLSAEYLREKTLNAKSLQQAQ